MIGAFAGEDFGKDPCATVISRSANLWGEVPASFDTVPCQLRTLGILPRTFPAEVDARVRVPLFSSDRDALVATANPAAPTDLAIPSGPLDPGPRYDYVLVTGCMNDVNGGAVLLHPNRSQVDEAIDVLCGRQLAGKLAFIGQQFPEATIVLTGYHQIFSADAFAVRMTPSGVRDLVQTLSFVRPVLPPMAVLPGLELNALRGVEEGSSLAKRRMDARLTDAAVQLSRGAGGRVVAVTFPDLVGHRAAFGNDAFVYGFDLDGEAVVAAFARAVTRAKVDIDRRLAEIGQNPIGEVLIALRDALVVLANNAVAFPRNPVEYVVQNVTAVRDLLGQTAADLTRLTGEMIALGVKPTDPPEIRDARIAACAVAYPDPIKRATCGLASAFHPNAKGAANMATLAETLRARGRFPSTAP